MIPELFSMYEKLYFEIQECGEDFIDYMLKYMHSGIDDLEESLLNVAKKISDHNYG